MLQYKISVMGNVVEVWGRRFTYIGGAWAEIRTVGFVFFQLDCMFLCGADIFPFSLDVHFCRERYEHDLLLILPNGVKSCEDITFRQLSSKNQIKYMHIQCVELEKLCAITWLWGHL